VHGVIAYGSLLNKKELVQKKKKIRYVQKIRIGHQDLQCKRGLIELN